MCFEFAIFSHRVKFQTHFSNPRPFSSQIIRTRHFYFSPLITFVTRSRRSPPPPPAAAAEPHLMRIPVRFSSATPPRGVGVATLSTNPSRSSQFLSSSRDRFTYASASLRLHLLKLMTQPPEVIHRIAFSREHATVDRCVYTVCPIARRQITECVINVV